eukprot:snap_masked-scaffold_71-processed-gene-0.42-mRNA-1 protein AED:0.01 eAED:0.01 QI:0/0.5/0.33/0.66/0.5/0.33/3/1090/75
MALIDIYYFLRCYSKSFGILSLIEITYTSDKNTEKTRTTSPGVYIELTPNKLIHNNKVNNKDRLFPIYPLETVRE